jgi:hypothetical protein
VVWEWCGSGVGVVWEWCGSGVGVVWEWCGSGVGVVAMPITRMKVGLRVCAVVVVVVVGWVGGGGGRGRLSQHLQRLGQLRCVLEPWVLRRSSWLCTPLLFAAVRASAAPTGRRA